MKEFLAEPGFLGTYGTIGTDLSYLLAVLFTALFLVSWNMGRRHQGNRHHFLILYSMSAMFVYFFFYYQVRKFGVLALEGKEGFGGPASVYAYIVRPIITIHVLLVTIGLIMAVYMLILGFRASFKENGKRLLREVELKAKRKNFFVALSTTVIVLGLLTVIRCSTFRCVVVYGVIILLVTVVFFLEKIVERLLPDGAKRHRVLGRCTMVIFLIVLFTTTLTYLLLYVFYQPQLPEG
jgi:uncharacterized membrane protein YozB (DUF420 family)